MRVLRRPRIVDDIGEAYAYLALRSPRSADRLLVEIEKLVELLAAFPEIGRQRVELGANVRSFRVRRFGHIVLYRSEPGEVVLLRLLHAARHIEIQPME